ncbi:MAG: hypothetical protein R6U88_01760 [Candidatus Bipolaricaulota bacterium]
MRRNGVVIAMIVVVGLGLVGLAASFGGWWGYTDAHEHSSEVHSMYMETVAERLGVEADELERIMLEAKEEVIDEALAAGLISEEHAQWMRECMEEGWQPRRGGMMGQIGPRGYGWGCHRG